MGFVLIKLCPVADPTNFPQSDLHIGTGFTTRKNAEYVVLCKRGRSLRRDAVVHEIIVTPRREQAANRTIVPRSPPAFEQWPDRPAAQ
jgi:hypothetical protein